MSLAGQIENQNSERQEEMGRDFDGMNDQQQEVSNSTMAEGQIVDLQP